MIAHPFKDAKRQIGPVNADSAANLIAASSDISLIIDEKGVITDLAFGDPDLADKGCEAWIGQKFADVVTGECVEKAGSLIGEAERQGMSRRREINHRLPDGEELPIRYIMVKAGKTGPMIAFGRDIRSLADLQQRLVRTQISMEREYERLREAESCYRLLFQVSSEAVLIVDPATMTVTDANPAAANILGTPVAKIVGRRVSHVFRPDDRDPVKTLLNTALSAGKVDKISAKLASDSTEVDLSAALFRQSESAHLLLRIGLAGTDGSPIVARERSATLSVMERMPDGLVVLSSEYKILSANAAFLDLIQTANLETVRGQSIDTWFLRDNVDATVLLANLREHGVVRRFAAVLRGELGSTQDVEITAVSARADNMNIYGLVFRRAFAPAVAANSGFTVPGRNAEQLTELIGHMSLKEVVRDATDVIERLCIDAALKLTRDNRASAAQLLGLSRQSLYAKMRRFGLGDLPSESESDSVRSH